MFWVFIFYSFQSSTFFWVLCTLPHSKHINSFKNEEMREKFHLSIKETLRHCTKWKTVYGSAQFGFWVFLFSLEATKKWTLHLHRTQRETENNMENVSAVHEKSIIIIKATPDTREKAMEKMLNGISWREKVTCSSAVDGKKIRYESGTLHLINSIQYNSISSINIRVLFIWSHSHTLLLHESLRAKNNS